MWTLIKKESLENILTLRFLIGFVACSLLFGVTTAVLVNDFKTDLEIARAAVQEQENLIEGWTVYSYVRPTAIKMPSPLSVFGSGKGAQWGSRMWISHTRIPAVASDETGLGESSNFLGLFRGLDFADVVQVCISLLAILLTFDAVCGEKERASLRLILSNSVGRTRLILGKFLGAVIALVPIIIFSFAVAIAIFLTFSPVYFSATDWVKIGLLLFLILLYGAAFAAVGLLISAFAHRSATSLVVSMIVWVLVIIVVPNSFGLFVSEMGFEEDSRELSRNLEELAGKHGGPVAEVFEGGPFQDHRATFALMNEGPNHEGRFMLRLVGPNALRHHLARLPEILKDQEDYAASRFVLEEKFLQSRFAKVEQITNLQRLSPASVFTHAASAIAGTDANGYKHFLQSTRNYRNEFMSYIRSKNGYTSKRWFTDDYSPGPLDDLLDKFETMTAMQQMFYLQMNMESLMDRIRPLVEQLVNDPKRRLDLSDMPRFETRPVPLADTLLAASLDILILIVFAAVCFALSYIRFLNYDVR